MVVAVVVALAASAPVATAAHGSTAPAVPTEQAVRMAARVRTEVDVVRVFDIGDLDSSTEDLAHRAAYLAGAASATGRSGTFSVTGLRRRGRTVQAAPPGWVYPVSYSMVNPDVATPLMGGRVGGILGWGGIVMSTTGAQLRQAQVGDSLTVVATDGRSVDLLIAAIVDDAVTGGSEVLISPSTGLSLGRSRASHVVIWNPRSRSALDTALRSVGLEGRHETRIRRSWDPPDPDLTLGLGATKLALGEFAYQVTPEGDVVIDPAWVASNISGGGARTEFQAIGVVAACHVTIRAALQSALREIAEAGLAGAFDLGNTNQYGGCFVQRFNRIGGAVGGSLSRHTWGMAFDMNTTTNAQGTVPQLDCRIVRIFRRHGFAWGGNFTRPDGMHFEWVGERRDQLAYPSRYCPNVIEPEPTESVPRG